MHALISGAGIAGPALAFFLAKTGACVTIVEKSKALLPHGQAIDIQGSAVTVAKRMGILDEIRRLNTTENGTQFIDPKGRPFAPFMLKEGISATSEFEILRGDLAAILYRATQANPNVTYLLGTTIKTVLGNNEESVTVELSNGETHEYDILIAADGQWSKLRKQCFRPEDITPVDTGMYAAYWTIPRLPSDNDLWNIYHALGSRIVGIRPDPHGTMRAIITHVPCNAVQKQAWTEASKSDRKGQKVFLKKEFADAGWQTTRLLDALDSATDFYFHDIRQIKMAKWSTGRVICLGDAAYCPSPLTGMGASLALTGAYTLAGELSMLREGEYPAKAFDAYEKLFRPFVEESQKIVPFVPGIAHPETATTRWLFQAMMWAISKIVPLLFSRFDASDETRDGYVLPRYPDFEEKVST